MAQYPQGGGHWSVRLQYMFGMTQIGADWRWLEVLRTSGQAAIDQARIHIFLSRMRHYGFGDRVAIALLPRTEGMNLSEASIHGAGMEDARAWIRNADIIWNFCCAFRDPLLSQFRKRALIDLDPGHIHVAALTLDFGIFTHDVHFTVGSKLADPDTLCPKLDQQWIPFWPLVYLPMWKVKPDPGWNLPFSSVTQWTWGDELPWKGALLSTSKRDAYLRYLELPTRVSQPMELAVNLDPADSTGDREMLAKNDWHLVHPHTVGHSPSLYRRYIQRCRAEFSCPKPVFRELKTGWFSDRSAAFLASGRPVLVEDTGFSDHIPTGRGLIAFTNMEEAIAGVYEIAANYELHAMAARELSEEYFDSTKVLRAMLDRC